MTAKARLQKARRLLEVQKGMKRLEEAKIAGLQSRQAELKELQEEFIGTLNSDAGPSALLVDAVLSRLKKLGEEAAQIAEELEQRMEALRAHTGRARQAEQRFRTYEQQHERGLAQKELLEVIERALRADDASLP